MRRKKQDGVYFFWSASIIICVLISIFAVGFASFAKSKAGTASVAAAAKAPSQESAANSANASTTPLAETSDMGQSYIDKFVFLGDSTTYGLGRYKIVPTSQVWTPQNGTLTLSRWSASTIVYEDGSQISIKDAATKKQPEYLMITLGVNGISFMDEEYFTTEYSSLVQTVQQASPNTKIILNSIYPIAASYTADKNITNDRINDANKWVQKIAANTGVRFLDSESVLKDSTGALNNSYQNGDGLHLNTDGYKLVINYIRTHGYN